MMQTFELVEVAGLLAAHAKSLVADQTQLPEQAIVDYWVASRCRFDSWGHDLRSYSTAAAKSQQLFGARFFRLATEIEASDVWTRVMAAIGSAHDAWHGRQETSPVVSNTLVCHRESMLRLQTLVASRDSRAAREVVRFRLLRHQLQELTDRLVGCLLPFGQVDSFAHNPARAHYWGEAASQRVARLAEPADWSELLATIAPLRRDLAHHGPNWEQNHRVAAATIGLLSPELFDSFGLLRTTWLRRLERVNDDTTVLLEEWLGITPENQESSDARYQWSEPDLP